MKKIFIFALILLSVNSLIIGQYKLIFTNNETDESIEIEATDYIKIEYRGYLSQRQSIKNYVSSVSDTYITMVNNSDKDIENNYYKINGEDITGFRKMWKLRPFIKPLANLGFTVGSYFFFENNKNISEGEAILYSLGVGIGFNFLLDFLFPDDIKYRISEGWSFKFN